ncbi:hypothetical protein PVK06_030350 [Gossypium arboreum]|uniref:Uncharacterized protein n=1 Tax=Gossypium arboreum TaxID=29729 RepID=A0ABR0NNY5_GOSAR|nr:hypothetical protein PVK06_030350 [Gossypium arboreum]
MSECNENMQAIRNHLDLVLEVIKRQVKEQDLKDECVKSDIAKVEKEASYTIIEKTTLKVNFQQEVEVKDSSEVLGDIEKTPDFHEFGRENTIEVVREVRP